MALTVFRIFGWIPEEAIRPIADSDNFTENNLCYSTPTGQLKTFRLTFSATAMSEALLTA
jgi:hypothetical protein